MVTSPPRYNAFALRVTWMLLVSLGIAVLLFGLINVGSGHRILTILASLPILGAALWPYEVWVKLRNREKALIAAGGGYVVSTLKKTAPTAKLAGPLVFNADAITWYPSNRAKMEGATSEWAVPSSEVSSIRLSEGNNHLGQLKPTLTIQPIGKAEVTFVINDSVGTSELRETLSGFGYTVGG